MGFWRFLILPLLGSKLSDYRQPQDPSSDIWHWSSNHRPELMFSRVASGDFNDFPVGRRVEVTFEEIIGFDLGDRRFGYSAPATTLSIERRTDNGVVTIVEMIEVGCGAAF